MGINHSLLTEDQQSKLSEYEPLESSDLSLYGPFFLVCHKPSDIKFFYKEFKIDKSFSNMTPELFFHRLTNPFPSLLRLNAGNIIDTGSDYEGFILIDAFDLEANLANNIGINSQGMRYFSEEELWKMLTSTLTGLEFMISGGKSALCVSPFHLYIQDEVYKILDFEDITDLMHNLDLSEPPMVYYQSPHLINALKDQEPIDINEKDNIFSLGLSVLEAALLEHPLNVSEGDFSFEGIENAFVTIKPRYSPNFIEFLRSMVNLDEHERPDLETLLIEIKRIERLIETPKSFKHKDELFGLGKSKINTGTSIPFSNDFRFSGQSPLNERAPKNMILGKADNKAIMEENESRFLTTPIVSDKVPVQDIQEIYYLSSEVLPNSDVFKSVESNSNQVPTFEDYRVSIQNKIEEVVVNRPSNENVSNRPSHFKKNEENVKRSEFPEEVNAMSLFTSHKGENGLEIKKPTHQSEDYEMIEFQSPEKVLVKTDDYNKNNEEIYKYNAGYSNYDNSRGYPESLNKEMIPVKVTSREENSKTFEENYLKMSQKATESNLNYLKPLTTENSTQMQHTSEFPYYQENKTPYNNENNMKEQNYQTSPPNYDYLDRAYLSQSFNYNVEKPQEDLKPLSQSYQIPQTNNGPQLYSIYQPIESQNLNAYGESNYLNENSIKKSYEPVYSSHYTIPNKTYEEQLIINQSPQYSSVEKSNIDQYTYNYSTIPNKTDEDQININQSPPYSSLEKSNIEKKAYEEPNYYYNYYQKPQYLEETKQLPIYQDLREKPMIVTNKPLEESKYNNYNEQVKRSNNGFILETNNLEKSEYLDKPVDGNKSLTSSFNKQPFEESRYFEQTPEKLFLEVKNLLFSEQRSLAPPNNNLQVIYSEQSSILKMKEVDEEFQRKSMLIQENKKSVDKSLNVLREACNFLKEKRIPLV